MTWATYVCWALDGACVCLAVAVVYFAHPVEKPKRPEVVGRFVRRQ